MINITGLLKDQQGDLYVGHVVAARFSQRPDIGGVQANGTQDSLQLWVPSQQRVPVEPGGEFLFSLPDQGELNQEDPLRLEVVAPDGEVLSRTEYDLADPPSEIEIEVEAKRALVVEPPPDPLAGKRAKVSGRVLDAAGKVQVADTQVILWARLENAPANEFRTVVAAKTDEQGYFFGEYATDKAFVEAYGEVAVGDVDRVPVRVEDGLLPQNVVLVIEVPEDFTPDASGVIPRAPGAQELTAASSTYSEDLGGGKCVQFTVPNRTLEEFDFYSVVRTTEPEIKGLTLAEPLRVKGEFLKQVLGIQDVEPNANPERLVRITENGSREESALATSAFQLLPGSEPIEPGTDPGSFLTRLNRAPVSATALKALVADPDRFTMPTLATAQRETAFKDVGSLLDLLKKPEPGRGPLTADNPVDWDDEPTFYQATTIAHGHLLHFKQAWKADGYSMGDLLYSLPLAPCQKKQIAIVDWDRQESGARTEMLEAEERLDASLNRDRDVSEIVNSTLSEDVRGGSRANVWGVGGGIGAAVGPVLVGVAGGASGASSSAWQTSSRRVAADSLQQIRDRTMQSATSIRSQRSTVVQTVGQGESMNVQTEVVANHNHCHAMTVEYFEVLRHLQVAQEIADVQECLFVPLLMSRFDPTKALRWREPLSRFMRNRTLVGGFAALERIANDYEGSDLPTGRYSEETIEDLDGELRISFQMSRPPDKQDGSLEPASWPAYVPWLTVLGLSPETLFNQYFGGQTAAQRDQAFRTSVAPRIAEAVVNSLKFYLVGADGGEQEIQMDATLVSSYAAGVPLYVSLRPLGGVPQVSREWVKRLEIRLPEQIANLPISALPPYFKATVHTGSVRYRTAHLSHFLFRGYGINNDLKVGDPVVVSTPLDRLELRNPRQEDREISKRLLLHLDEHVEHYHRAIWWGMDPERRYMLLDGFKAPNAGERSVASVVENRLIGIVGNSLILPVARGHHLDPTYRQDADNPVDLIDHYRPNTPIPATRVSVPTRGVFAEAVMGSCNSCEVKDETRFWRWEESPCGDEPTSIQPVSTESRRSEAPDLEAKDFPSPIVQMQQAPQAPDPTGLAAMLQLLGTPNIFKDITGLEGNQRAALEAFKSSLETAKTFGTEAAKLTMQQAMSRDVDRTMQAIEKAKNAGLITDQQAKDLTGSALEKLVGGQTKPPKTLTDEPEVKKLIDSASEGEADVSLSRGGESVDVKLGEAAEGSGFSLFYEVPGVVPGIAQPTAMTCWATVTTMMLSWRDRTSYTIDRAMQIAGPDYQAIYKNPDVNKQGLPASKKEGLLTATGMVGEPPMNYSVLGILDLLKKYGPLWVTTDEDPSANFAIHARILTGIFGDGTPNGTRLRIVDPADGKTHDTETFAMFARKFEEEARDSGSASLRIQVVHFAQELSEGGSSSARTLSGASWVSRFRGSKDVKDLEDAFRTKVEQFTGAIEDAGGTVAVTSTLRPIERAYLMHWSWRIAKQNFDAQAVPPQAGVDIEWWHGDAPKSKKAAQEMVDGFGINQLDVAPSLTSRHIQGKAIDMQISWESNLKIKNADGTEKNIASMPRDHTNADLIEVGKTYGVIHFTPVDKDKVHWSTDGK